MGNVARSVVLILAILCFTPPAIFAYHFFQLIIPMPDYVVTLFWVSFLTIPLGLMFCIGFAESLSTESRSERFPPKRDYAETREIPSTSVTRPRKVKEQVIHAKKKVTRTKVSGLEVEGVNVTVSLNKRKRSNQADEKREMEQIRDSDLLDPGA